MPVTLSQIAGNVASITLKIQSGDTSNDLTIEYYPSKVTEETFSQLQAFDHISDGNIAEGFGSLNDVLCTLIKSWDLFEDNEQTIMYPITPDALKKLPIFFRISILQGIMGDIRPGNDSASNELTELRRYLVLQHKGIATDYACPDWYIHIQAAKYLGVPPWDLVKQSVYWRDKALAAMSVEHEASEIINNHPK